MGFGAAANSLGVWYKYISFSGLFSYLRLVKQKGHGTMFSDTKAN